MFKVKTMGQGIPEDPRNKGSSERSQKTFQPSVCGTYAALRELVRATSTDRAVVPHPPAHVLTDTARKLAEARRAAPSSLRRRPRESGPPFLDP